MSSLCCFTLVPWQLWLYGDYPTGCRLPVGLTKLLVVTQLTCGPNEAPGRNKVVWSFICGPNEAPDRSQVMRSFTCGPNEAPGRSLIVWSFTRGPNEAPGRSQVVWSFTCGPNEAPSRSFVTWPWVFVVLCFWKVLVFLKVLENYMAHMVYYVVSRFISWKAWCCIILSNLSDYCKEDDFERIYVKVSKSTLCFVICFNISKLAFPLTPLFMLPPGL